MRRRLAIVIALALVVACQWPGCQKGPLVVKPTSARPGEMIRLHQNRGDFQSFNSLRVTIGGEPSFVSRVISNTDLDVVVPMRAAGKVEIQLYDGSQLETSTAFAVLDSDCRRFVMRLHGTQVTVLRVEPCFDMVQRDAETLNPRLSFDLVNAQGQTLYTTSIAHPIETQAEVFSHSSRGATIERHDARDPAVFWVRFPNLPAAKGLRVYYVPAGVDLADSVGTSNRVPIDTLEAPVHGP